MPLPNTCRAQPTRPTMLGGRPATRGGALGRALLGIVATCAQAGEESGNEGSAGSAGSSAAGGHCDFPPWNGFCRIEEFGQYVAAKEIGPAEVAMILLIIANSIGVMTLTGLKVSQESLQRIRAAGRRSPVWLPLVFMNTVSPKQHNSLLYDVSLMISHGVRPLASA